MMDLQEVEIKKVGVFAFAGFFSVVGLLMGIVFSIVMISGISIATSIYPKISIYTAQYLPSNLMLMGAISLTFLVFGFVIGIFSALI